MYTTKLEKVHKGNLDFYLQKNSYFIKQTSCSLWLHKSTHWIESWLEAFSAQMSSEGDEPWVFLTEEITGQDVFPIGIFFLVRKKGSFPVKLISAGKIFGSPGPLITNGREEEFLENFLDALKKEFKFYFLDLAPTNEPWIDKPRTLSFPQLGRRAGLEISEYLDAPYIDLDKFQCLQSKALSEQIARTKRNFQRDSIQVEFTTLWNENINDQIVALYELHETAWPKSIFKRDGGVYRNFFKLLARNNPELSTRLDVLRLDGAIASIVFGVIVRNRYYYLAPTYSFKFSKFSPGSLLIMEIILHLKSNGIKVFDFMNSLESYKLKWTDHVMPRYKYIFYSHIFFSPNIIYFIPRVKAKLRLIVYNYKK